jgi:CBS domain containing-hemolysin-like protein
MENNVKAGYNEEISQNGTVSKSKMRQMSGLALWAALSYLFISIITNIWFWSKVFDLLDKSLISKELFTIMLTSFSAVNVSVFLILIVGAFAPKAIQKFAENKLK